MNNSTTYQEGEQNHDNSTYLWKKNMEFEASENFQNQKYIHCYRQDIRDTIVTFGSEILESTDNNIVEWVDQVIQKDAEGKWRRCNIFITELLKLGGEKKRLWILTYL